MWELCKYTADPKVLNHIQTALVLISLYPRVLLGIFDVGLLRVLANPHPVSDHNVKTDKNHTVGYNDIQLQTKPSPFGLNNNYIQLT